MKTFLLLESTGVYVASYSKKRKVVTDENTNENAHITDINVIIS